MGSVHLDNFMVNGDQIHESISGGKDNVAKLHDIVTRLEEENEFLLPLRQNEQNVDHSTSNSVVSDTSEEKKKDNDDDMFNLENVPPLDEREFDDVEFEKDGSWLYSPKKEPQAFNTPTKNPELWLKENAVTPELLRVRSSLSEKLEVIAIENRKGRYDRLRKTKEDFRKGSTLSLDWDFEDEEELSSFGGGSDLEIAHEWEGEMMGPVKPRSIHAWAENSLPPQQEEIKTFSLDWSDEDDDGLSPMQLNLSQAGTYRINKNPAMKRGFQAASPAAAVRPRSSNNSQESNEFTPKLSGGVKPRRSAPPPARDIEMHYEDDIGRSSSSSPSYEYENSVSPPVMPRGAVKRGTHSADVMVPRGQGQGQGNIAKPVPRRKPLEPSEADHQVRPRTAGTPSSHVRPRGSLTKPSPNSSSENLESAFKVSLSSVGPDGPVVRRRGAQPPPTAEVAPMPRRLVDPSPSRHNSNDRSPLRTKDPLSSVRQQDVPLSRRSTGSSIAQPRGSDNIARPRRSNSPTARPRGSSPVARPRGAPS